MPRPLKCILLILLATVPLDATGQTGVPTDAAHQQGAGGSSALRPPDPWSGHAAAASEGGRISTAASPYAMLASPSADSYGAASGPGGPAVIPDLPSAAASPSESRKPLPRLSPPSGPSPAGPRRDGASTTPIATVASSLALVLGLFLLVAWLMKRTAPAASAVLPSEVLEVLGRKALGNHQQVHLLRCGNKLLLVSVTSSGAETLAEISDPDEVTRLTGLCRRSLPNSASEAFRHVFQQFANPRKPEQRHV